MLLNTHCHIDHVFGNDFVSREYGLTLHMHPFEKPLLDHAPASGLMFNLPFDNYQGAVEHLSDGQQLFSGDDLIHVLLTPGHSPGSLSFYCPAQHFLISGDVLFYRSIGRTDLPGGDFDTLISSIREKLFVLPPQTRVYTGHGMETTIGEELEENPFLQ
jgi:glyoxylase-like metal-dependent hydrolase (beta-lactamase superfamily II)